MGRKRRTTREDLEFQNSIFNLAQATTLSRAMEDQPIFQDLALEAIIIVLDITQEIAITHKLPIRLVLD